MACVGCRGAGEENKSVSEDTETKGTDDKDNDSDSPTDLEVDTSTEFDSDDFEAREEAFRKKYFALPASISGRVIDRRGAPIEGAAAESSGVTALTDTSGRFVLSGLERRNTDVAVSAEGKRPERLAAKLTMPIEDSELHLGDVVLDDRDPGVVRFLFAGDMAMGRRFLDVDESTPWDEVPPDDPEAWIQTSNPEPGSREIVRLIEPLFRDVDFAAVNLESVVTDEPHTPYWVKDYSFFTLPGSLVALDELGIDYVSLGNNHIYDYLDKGVSDTIYHITNAGVAYSGAGEDSADAFEPYRAPLGGNTYAFISATSVSGSQFDVLYVAQDDKAGAADLRDGQMTRGAVEAALEAGEIPIALVHTGKEYTYRPSDYALSRVETALEAGAALVVGHHPHVAQGFDRSDKGVLVAHSLGNFVLDQDRHETMMGLVVRVDMKGDQATSLRGYPIYIEDYRPRRAVGRPAGMLLRRLAEVSNHSNLTVSVSSNYLDVYWDQAPPARERTVETTVLLEESEAVIDLRGIAEPNEWLSAVSVKGGTNLQARLGRDILLYGSFDDNDIDDESIEASRWDLKTSSKEVCLEPAFRGEGALCSYRGADQSEDSVIAFRNRVRFWDNPDGVDKDLSLLGYVRGDGCGPLAVVVRYYAGELSKEFGEETLQVDAQGTFDWRFFHLPLAVPPDEAPADDTVNNPRALRLFLRHSPPSSGKGRAVFDDIAVISWEEEVRGDGTRFAPEPHARDFLKVKGPVGTYRVELTLRRND